MSKRKTLARKIESAVAEHSLLKHPFYQAWSSGSLTKEQLAGYAKEYYWAARHVPAIMTAVKKNAPHNMPRKTRAIFQEQVEEERGHIRLWERFARSLDISQKELRAYKPTKTVRSAVAKLMKTAKKGFEQGVAAMYAFECELPAISKTKSNGLRKFYGLTSVGAHEYFREHMKEAHHLKLWQGFLATMTPQKRHTVLGAARETVTAQNRILDGVIERYCPNMNTKHPLHA